MPKRTHYIFLCVNERPPGHPKGCCTSRGAGEIRDRFAEVLGRENLLGQVRVVRTSCLDNCTRGAALAVYPDDVWYQGVQADDVEEIVESHLKGGRPVERLILPPTEFD
jgi:(2Fe-2S) ferredoxin